MKTREIPRESLAEVAARWHQEQADRDIVDLMLHEWLGATGVPLTSVHRALCHEALAWGRALPLTTTLSRARVAAITGGPGDALHHLLIEYTRHTGRC